MANSVRIPEEILATLNVEEFSVVKNENLCATLETPSYFFKIREFPTDDARVYFDCIIGEAFAEEYRRMGIEWEFLTKQLDDGFYEIEKRQKLKFLAPTQFSLEEAVEECEKTTAKIERKLGFSDAVRQIRKEVKFKDVKRIFIRRNNDPSFDDYASLNGKNVCLGTSKRYLALADAEGNLLKDKENMVKMVNLNFGKCCFSSLSATRGDKKGRHHFSNDGRWWLFSEEVGEKLISDYWEGVSQLKEMNITNLKILTEQVAHSVYSKDENKAKEF